MMDRDRTPRVTARDRWELHNWLERFLARERRKALRHVGQNSGGYGCTIMVPGRSAPKQRLREAVNQSVIRPREQSLEARPRSVNGPQLGFLLFFLLTIARLVAMHYWGEVLPLSQPPVQPSIEQTYLERVSSELPLPPRPWTDTTRLDGLWSRENWKR